MLTEVLAVNWIILYFVYGQVFFITGLVTGLQWRRGSHLELARPLPWLAAFGLSHGLNEWGYIFIPLQALYLSDWIVRLMVVGHLLLLAVSFLFLFQFGVELTLLRVPRLRWLRAIPGLVFLVWMLAVLVRGTLARDPLNVLVAIGDGWSRYFLSLPGSILAGLGLLHQARQVRDMDLPQIANYLIGAALAFCVYGLFGGLVVPTAPIFPANWVNYSLLDKTVHLPAPVFRSLCGLAMAFFIVRSLNIFQVETDRRLAEMERAQTLVAERERIGRDLHDGIIQNIYAAGLTLEEIRYLIDEDPFRARQRIQVVMKDLDRIIQDIRRYIFDLRALEQVCELESVLRTLVRDLRLDTLLEVDLEVKGQRCCWLDSRAIGEITQIAREALSNVVKHSRASHVMMQLEYLGDSTRLTIADNGRGMDPHSPNLNLHHGQGITNMRHRALSLGGELELDTRPGQGLVLTLTIPCASQEQAAEVQGGNPWD